MTTKSFSQDVWCPRCGGTIEAGSPWCNQCGLIISEYAELAGDGPDVFSPVENIAPCVYGPPKMMDSI